MVAPKRLARSVIAEAPYEVWNAFVDICIFSPYAELDAVQRVGHLALWYDSEVNNGGHLQYLENRGLERVPETIEALERIGAESQARVLSRAFRYHEAATRGPIRSVRQFVQVALSPGYLALDRAFHACEPETGKLLEQYLEEHEGSFVERVDG